MTKNICLTLNKEIKSLMTKHFDIEKSIEKLQNDLSVDFIQIEKLKKEKLQIKDTILEKQNELTKNLNVLPVELIYDK
jgi:hypothetical protein